MQMRGPYQAQVRTTLPITPEESGLKILMVDPDFASAERLAAALRPRHMVAVVGSAQAALTAIMISVPHLIVTALDLPDANGVELVARWHAEPLTRHTLLMIVTHRRSVLDKIAGLQAGADDYLVKPVDPLQFAMHVQSVSRFRKVLPGVERFWQHW